MTTTKNILKPLYKQLRNHTRINNLTLTLLHTIYLDYLNGGLKQLTDGGHILIKREYFNKPIQYTNFISLFSGHKTLFIYLNNNLYFESNISKYIIEYFENIRNNILVKKTNTLFRLNLVIDPSISEETRYNSIIIPLSSISHFRIYNDAVKSMVLLNGEVLHNIVPANLNYIYSIFDKYHSNKYFNYSNLKDMGNL